MTYKVTIIEQQEKWMNRLHQTLQHDVYHTWDYHKLDKNGEPLLFVYEEDDTFVAIPFIRRGIPGTLFCDLTSVYGYAGPVSNKRLPDLPAELTERFRQSLINFAKSIKCVSIFSRLHPFLEQTQLIEKIGGLRPNGHTIYIDLSMPLEEQRSRYEKRLNRRIRQLRNKGYVVREAGSTQDIRQFTEMYNENMERINASATYFFDEAYFRKLLQCKDFNSKLIMAYDGEHAVGGAVIMYTDTIIRNHLSATHSNWVKESPSKLITDEISLIGRELGIQYFHLGGGAGGKEDSLFTFKSYFSNQFLDDHIWCHITDQAAYNELSGPVQNEKDTHFPLYRSKNRQALSKSTL